MKYALLCLLACMGIPEVGAQTYKFMFETKRNQAEGYILVRESDTYTASKGYGYDTALLPESGSKKSAFFFSVALPDGNYRVTALLGNRLHEGETTVRAESRRLYFERVETRRKEYKTCTFVVNKRDTCIAAGESVRIKPRERRKLNWDEKLTLEFNGKIPCLSELRIERVDDVPTVFLFGNSTVVDQSYEPWGSWGQMIPRFFTDGVCFANYAESGESANTFISNKRLQKALTQMKPGDYAFIEFGHNDQKQKGPGKGAYYSYMTSLKTIVDEVRARKAHPVLVTPTQRRSFDAGGRIADTHENYPEAMRWLAVKENIPLIDLHEMTRTLYEALGVEPSKRAFVHYPAGSYPGQDKTLADNTHFNPYGAYQIAKCVIEGMKKAGLALMEHLRADYPGYDPSHPDSFDSFRWDESPFTEIEKPDGN